jgi:ABC-2 type transport system permease protein
MNQLRVFRYGLLVGARDFSTFWTWKTWVGGWMLRIVTNVVMWVMMGKLLHSPEQLHYLLIGNAAVAGLGTFALPAASWDRFDGTHSLLVMSPSSLAPSVMGRMSIWMFGWIASSLLTFAILLLAFDFPVSLEGAIAIVVLEPLLCINTLFISGFLGALASLAPKLRNLIAWVLIFLTSALCGVNVSVSFWPPWVQFIANIMPVTHGLEAMRLALAGAPAAAIFHKVFLEILVGLGWFVLAVLCFGRTTERSRADGSIDFA